MTGLTARERAAHFVERETAFHLGALPTEQAHSHTADLDRVLADDTAAGIDCLLSVDEDIVPMARRVTAGEPFEALVDAFFRAMRGGRRIAFTGCGATGRLSILLEAAWRECWRRLTPGLPASFPNLEGLAVSVMAGGDYALIRSVEGFEDFSGFGRYQLRESGVGEGDVVVAITEGGETSFVIGTAWEGVDLGAEVFFVFNNPAPVLAATVARSREVLEDARITSIDLATGPMALAGSTRMQAATAELLVVGAALETALKRFLEASLPAESRINPCLATADPRHCADRFAALLERLRTPDNLAALAAWTEFERDIHTAGGRVTYAATDRLLDVLTDTTERSPTFSLPPFRKFDDAVAPVSWAFLKHPSLSTAETWRELLGREPRCLEWDGAIYAALGAPEALVRRPPKLDRDELLKFRIGAENDPSRYATGGDALVALRMRAGRLPDERAAFERMAGPFARAVSVSFAGNGGGAPGGATFVIDCPAAPSALDLWGRLVIKLTLNVVSTATMALMGRVTGNWMTCVAPGNKKLVDRGTRLIAELTGVSYPVACRRLFEAVEAVRDLRGKGEHALSPVEWSIRIYGVATVRPLSKRRASPGIRKASDPPGCGMSD